ncbi:unnamed protein product [Eruca vesicaria subsp. sativa]|uniref:Uncharacterized protein n=1 Tax=Eruca vesicaria subsp. sativa TaxID=29727 RepID=A0ABC8J2L7_ERUVS|nr:unnamed protein product [Eruca vesicaria subsp. sativa]
MDYVSLMAWRRTLVVVLGSLVFGYMSLELGYKPFLEKAEQYQRSLQSQASQHQQHQQQQQDNRTNNKFATPEETAIKAIAAAREWNNSQSKETVTISKKNLSIPIPSRSNLIRIDAAWNEPLLFVRSPLTAEGLALRATLLKGKELNIVNVRCESDSAQLVQAQQSNDMRMDIYGITADIEVFFFCQLLISKC